MRLGFIINNGDGRILSSPLKHGQADGRRHPWDEERMMKLTGRFVTIFQVALQTDPEPAGTT